MARIVGRGQVKPKLYTGYVPSNVNKDAKYKVSARGEVHLLYRIDHRTRELLSTTMHAELVKMVNGVKEKINHGVPGGAFYINEFGEVLVPGLDGLCYWAGCYDPTLTFSFEGSVISPVAPTGLEPGDRWPGPHSGVRYKLCAGGRDIAYLLQSGARSTEFRLSHFHGDDAAETAAKISSIKGTEGGRFYINERRELFGPVSGRDGFLYFGHLEDSVWFDPPEGYDRP
jgi:hypothetical protein